MWRIVQGNQLIDVPDSQTQEEIVQQNKTLHVIKMDLVRKFLEMFAEIAELSDDVKEFFGVHDDSTVGAKIAELLRLNVSTSNVQKTAEVPQAQFIDKVVDVPVDMQRQAPAVQVVQKTAEVTNSVQ